MELDKILGLW